MTILELLEAATGERNPSLAAIERVRGFEVVVVADGRRDVTLLIEQDPSSGQPSVALTPTRVRVAER